jgi:hypothetical protein
MAEGGIRKGRKTGDKSVPFFEEVVEILKIRINDHRSVNRIGSVLLNKQGGIMSCSVVIEVKVDPAILI